MRNVQRIFIHTSASFNSTKGLLDPSAADIRAMHKGKGWSDIGYHAVIRRDGRLEAGRPLEKIGAGVNGANKDSLHICCTGHGDHEDFTDSQKKILTQTIYGWLKRYGLLDEFKANMMRVVGHREVNTLVDAGIYPATYKTKSGKIVKVKTSKSCPGSKVNMAEIRKAVFACGKGKGWK